MHTVTKVNFPLTTNNFCGTETVINFQSTDIEEAYTSNNK